MSDITCIPLDGFPKGIITELAERLARMLRAPVVIGCDVKTLDHAFDPGRQQYDSSKILSVLSRIAAASSDLVLGVTNYDLFLPYLSMVFGAAIYRGRVAVVSVSRLASKNTLLHSYNELFYDRLVKESMHELGHAQGLDHCIDPYCVMHESFCVSDLDEKTLSFCSVCCKELRTRYKQIRFLKPIS